MLKCCKFSSVMVILSFLWIFCQGCTTTERVRTVSVPRDKPYKVGDTWYFPFSQAHGYKEVGIASWYGDPFHGKRTSSGETYDMHTVSAAHKLLPLGTYVRVKNLENNRSIDLRINDRGPFIQGRIIDLSYAAAQQLGVVRPGTVKVEVTALGTPAQVQRSESVTDTIFGGLFGESEPETVIYKPADYYNGNFTVQVGAFGDLKNAQNLSENLKKTYGHAQVVPSQRGDQKFYRVLVGRWNNLDLAQQYESNLKEKGFPGAFTLAE